MAENSDYAGSIRILQDNNVLEIASTGKLRTFGNVRLGSSGSTGSTGTVQVRCPIVLDSTSMTIAATRSLGLTAGAYVQEYTQTVTSTVLTTGAAKKPAWTALAAYGRSDLSCTGSSGAGASMAFSLAHPGVAGVRKRICLVNGSTAKPATVEVAAVTQYIGGATGSTAKTNHRIVFNDVNEAVELESGSSVAWRLISNNGTAVLSTNFTT